MLRDGEWVNSTLASVTLNFQLLQNIKHLTPCIPIIYWSWFRWRIIIIWSVPILLCGVDRIGITPPCDGITPSSIGTNLTMD